MLFPTNPQLAGILAVGRLDNTVGELEGLERFRAVLDILKYALMCSRHYNIPADDGRVPCELRADLLRHFVAEPDTADIIRSVADKPSVEIA